MILWHAECWSINELGSLNIGRPVRSPHGGILKRLRYCVEMPLEGSFNESHRIEEILASNNMRLLDSFPCLLDSRQRPGGRRS